MGPAVIRKPGCVGTVESACPAALIGEGAVDSLSKPLQGVASRWRAWSFALGLTIFGGGVQAAGPAATAAGAAEPDATTATFGDWQLQCRRSARAAGVPACELLHTIVGEGQRPVVRVAIGRPSAQAPLTLAVMFPANVSFAELPRLGAAEASAPALSLAWRRCLPIGCFADAALTDSVTRQWRGLQQPGRLTFQDGGGSPVELSVSFRGLGEALDALARK